MPPTDFRDYKPEDWVKAVAGLFTLAVIGALGYGAWTFVNKVQAAVETAPAQSAWVSPAAALPADEARFVAIIAASQAAYRSAANEMAAGGVRADRQAKLCATMKFLKTDGWVGRVATLTSSNDGKGVLEIAIADKVSVGTYKDTFSDGDLHTTIEPKSDLFKAASALKVGDAVVFSGAFFRDAADCVKETSLTLDGSMDEPEFLFRFSSIKKI